MTKESNPKIILWDLETANGFHGDSGYILCGAWKELGKSKINVVRIDRTDTFGKDVTDDRQVVAELAPAISDADIWVTHYGSRFDKKYLQTRMLKHGLGILPPIPMVDTWMVAKTKLALRSNRQEAIGRFLGETHKTHFDANVWLRAQAGHRKSMDFIVDHARKDIIDLEANYLALRPLMTNHPNVNLINDHQKGTIRCPVCQSKNVHSRGYAFAFTRKYHRYQCYSCGTWSRGKAIVSGLENR